MHMNKLGRTGLLVSELCLGTMTFGGEGEIWSKIGQLGQDEADALIARAIEGGVNFIDTADVYGNGASERITGQSLHNLNIDRENVVLATKVYGPMGSGKNQAGASRKHIIEGIKHSLDRLQTNYVDLYQIHGVDPVTPIAETVAALHTIVEHGHVRYVGVSNWAAWQIVKALGIAEKLGLHRFESLQAYYTVAGRDLEREIVPMLQSEGLGLMVWSPLAGGLLSGKYDLDGKGEGRRAAFDFPPVDRTRAQACIAAMRPMADARGVSVAQIALAWLLHQRVVSSVIIGAKRIEQLEDNLAAADIELTGEELDRLTEVSALPREYPGWMFAQQGMRAKVLAGLGHPGAR